MDLTHRRNVALLITITLMLLAIVTVLAAKGFPVFIPVEVTMVASGVRTAV